MLAIDVVNIITNFDSSFLPLPELFFGVRPRSRSQDHLELAQVEKRAREALLAVGFLFEKEGMSFFSFPSSSIDCFSLSFCFAYP